MTDIAGFPYREIQFTKQGEVFEPQELQAAVAMVKDENVTDLLVISHGWNNDMEDARDLYQELGGSLRQELERGARQGLEGARIGIVGVFWPSKRFGSRTTAGGAAGLGSAEAEELLAELDDLGDGEIFDAENAREILDELRVLVRRMEEDDEDAPVEFADLARKLVDPDGTDVDSGVDEDFLTMPGDDLIDALSGPVFDVEDDGEQGGGAAGLGGGAASFSFGSLFSGPTLLLNLTTFYQMKKRALTTGQGGGNEVLSRLLAASSFRLHLVGHSFGGLLVSAAVYGPGGDSNLEVDSLSLLQAAFSHNGFAENFRGDKDGLFRPVITESRVKGPIIVTHTKNDQALRIPYATGARTRRQDAVAIGDNRDLYGAMGSNGAQSTPEVNAGEDKLQAAGSGYDFVPSKVHNLLADQHISGHSDVRNRAVANAILEAMRKRSG